MSEKEEGPKRKAWFSFQEPKKPNPWKNLSIRRLIEESRAYQLEAAKELARRAYDEPRQFYQKYEVMRILEGLAQMRDGEVASRFIAVLNVLANGSPGVFDSDHIHKMKELVSFNKEVGWILDDLSQTRGDLRPTLPPPPPPNKGEGGQVLFLPWVDYAQRGRDRVTRRAKELFSVRVEYIRVTADSIDFYGRYKPGGAVSPTERSFPFPGKKKGFDPDPGRAFQTLFTNQSWTRKIEAALARSERGAPADLARLTRLIQRYVDEPAVDFSAVSDSKYSRLRVLLGLVDSRLEPALKALQTPWLIEIAEFQHVPLHDLGRLAERGNLKALFGLVDLSNRGYASAREALHHVEVKTLVRTALEENDPEAALDLARFAERGMNSALMDLFALGHMALDSGKEKAALPALEIFAKIIGSKDQDPFHPLVVQSPTLFKTMEARADQGEISERWLDLLKNYTLLTHYGALDLLARAGAILPSARQRLLEVQKSIPKEKVPEVFEFQGVVDPAAFEGLQFKMRRQKIRKMAVERLQALLKGED